MKESCYSPKRIGEDAKETAKSVKLVDYYVVNLDEAAPYSATNSTALIRYNNMLSAAQTTVHRWRSGGGLKYSINTLFNQALSYGPKFNKKYDESERLINRIKNTLSTGALLVSLQNAGVPLTPAQEAMLEKMGGIKYGDDEEVGKLIDFLGSVRRDVSLIKKSAKAVEVELKNFRELLNRDRKEFTKVDSMFKKTITSLERKTVRTERAIEDKKRVFEESKGFLQEEYKERLDKELEDFNNEIDEEKRKARIYLGINIGISFVLLGGTGVGAIGSAVRAGRRATALKIVGGVMQGVGVASNLGTSLYKYFTGLELERMKDIRARMNDWLKSEIELEHDRVLLTALGLDMKDLKSASETVDSLLPKLNNAIDAVASLQVTLCETSNYLIETINEAKEKQGSALARSFIRFRISEIKFSWDQAFERVMRFADYLGQEYNVTVVDPVISVKEGISNLLSTNLLAAEKADELVKILSKVDLEHNIEKLKAQEMATQINNTIDKNQCRKVVSLLKDTADLPCNVIDTVEDSCRPITPVNSTESVSSTTAASTTEYVSGKLTMEHIDNLVGAFTKFTEVSTMINTTAVELLCTAPTIEDIKCDSLSNNATYPLLYTLCNPKNTTEFCDNSVNATNSLCNSTDVTNTTTEAPSILNATRLLNFITTPFFVHSTEPPVMLTKLPVDSHSFNESPKTKHSGNSAINIGGFVNCENMSLASCVANALDGKGKRYEQIQQIAPYTHAPGLTANKSLKEFKHFIRKELRHYSKADRTDVHSELVGILPKIRDDLQRSVELEGRHGLRHCLKLHKKQFSELLSSYEKQPAKVSTFLSCPDLEVLASTTLLR